MSKEEVTGSPIPASGLDVDLESARKLLEDPPWKDNPQKYRKSAETILRRILNFDPENAQAKALMVKAKEQPETLTRRFAPPSPGGRGVSPEPAYVVGYVKPAPPPAARARSAFPVTLLALVVFTGALIARSYMNDRETVYVPTASAGSTPVSAPAPVAEIAAMSAQEPPPIEAEPVIETPAPAVEPPVAVAVPSPAPSPKHAAPAAPGTLAVSSPVKVDIYSDGQYVASVPTTLELPPGTHTLEYRHQNLRRQMAHAIRSGETATAMVTFDITVQINARPWAQVFIEGSRRQLLGQTPLSDVQVPIGSVLVFENPNFPGKTYRVTGKETEIRVNFP
jgi:hypothetical protein